MRRTKEYFIRASGGYICVSIKTNSVKQAIQRFTKKYQQILKGSWFFDVYDHSSMIKIMATFEFNPVHSFVNKLLERGIKATIENDTGRNYTVVVPLSGGKDSQACYEMALQQHGSRNVLALFCDTNFEHKKTYEHVMRLTKHKPLVRLNAGKVEDVMYKHNRFPHGLSRFCTDELKIRPSKFFYKYFSLERGGFDVWYGIRSDESKQREKRYAGKLSTEKYTPNEFMASKYTKELGTQGVRIVLPVLEWSAKDIFSFLNGRENPLYREGFDRVGCFPCMISGDKYKRKAFTHDDIGNEHYIRMKTVSDALKEPIYSTKSHKQYNAEESSGCSFCEM